MTQTSTETRHMAAGAVVAVVEDDASMLRALGRLLRTAGFTVRAFVSAEDFLQVAHGPMPDCLVLDVQLGGISGFDLHERLRARGAQVPTIFITAHDEPGTREQARRAGAIGFLRKPFDDQALITVIEQAVH